MGILISFVDTKRNYSFRKDIESKIKSILTSESRSLGEINLIFTSNLYILEINRKFLKHDYFTDVITFSESKRNSLSGDIYISVDQVRQNADRFNTTEIIELSRVIIHGILHLIGYNDKSESEQKLMREKEDTYLCKFKWNDIIRKSEARL